LLLLLEFVLRLDLLLFELVFALRACVFLEEEFLVLATGRELRVDLVVAALLLGVDRVVVALLEVRFVLGVAFTDRFVLFFIAAVRPFVLEDLVATERWEFLLPIVALEDLDVFLLDLGAVVTVLLLLVLTADVFLTFLELLDLVLIAVVLRPEFLLVLATLLPRLFLVI
jgi:hypothetical protein